MTATLTRLAFRIEPKRFASAVAWAFSSVPSRPSIPTLACVKLTVSDGTLTVAGFDYETATQATVDVESASDGVALVSGRLLAKLVETFPAKPVEARIDGTELRLTCGSVEVTLPTLPVEDYPQLPEMPPVVGAVDAEVLARSVKRVAVAASHDETLPELTGVLFVLGERMQVMATNRYRVALDAIDWAPGGVVATEFEVDAAALARAVASLEKLGGSVALSLDAGLVGFAAGGHTITLQQFAKRFASEAPPKLLAMVVDGGPTTVRLPVPEFLDATRRADLVHADKTPVVLAFADGLVKVSASGEARAATIVDCDFEGEPITIKVNPEFMRDAVAACGGAEVAMSFLDNRRGFLVAPTVEGDAYRHLIQPIRQD